MEKIYGNRTDLIVEKRLQKEKWIPQTNNIFNFEENNKLYRVIYFSNINTQKHIKETLKMEILFFLRKMNLHQKSHFFIVGLGNENYTADAVGPKTLKHLNINAFLDTLGLNSNTSKISALEPGVLGQTGIETKRIIESVVEEIKPDIIILVDSFVTKNIEYLNKTIQLTNEGIIPGSGLKSIQQEISQKTMNIPVLVIGVPTAIEITLKSNKKEENFSFLLSTKDIDNYVITISKIIGEALNEVIYDFDSR